jgi:amino acid transporter
LEKRVLMVVLPLFSCSFTALACSFAAFAYAEFASMVPVSGSAYTYSMLLLEN